MLLIRKSFSKKCSRELPPSRECCSDSSGVYIWKSIVNYLRHGNFICKSKEIYLVNPQWTVRSNQHVDTQIKLLPTNEERVVEISGYNVCLLKRVQIYIWKSHFFNHFYIIYIWNYILLISNCFLLIFFHHLLADCENIAQVNSFWFTIDLHM